MRRAAYLLPLFAAALALAGLEVAVRARQALSERRSAAGRRQLLDATFRLHQPSDDPELGYELRPGVTVERDGTTYRINAQGLRDDDDVSGDGRERRILVLGDSVAFGFGVPFTDTVGEWLEPLLARDGAPVRVLNLSTLGYRTAQEVRAYERRGAVLRPAGVVLAFCLNDFDDYRGPPAPDAPVSFGLQWDPPRRVLGVELPARVPWFDRSRLFRTVADRFRVDYYRWIASDPTRQRAVGDAFQRLAGRLAADGVRALVAIVPLLVDVEPYPYAGIHQTVVRLAAAAGLPAIDLLDRVRAPLGTLRLAPADVLHLSAGGHRAFAELLAPCLRNPDLRCPPKTHAPPSSDPP